MRSIPGRETRRKTHLTTIRGTVPDPFLELPGCPFHPRCDEAVRGLCDVGAPPPLVSLAPGHSAACFVRMKEMGLTTENTKDTEDGTEEERGARDRIERGDGQ